MFPKRWHGLTVILLTHFAANTGGYAGATSGDAGASAAVDCRCFLCSRVACAQAAAAARVAGKDGIHKAAERGDVAAVLDHLIADASCVEQLGSNECVSMPPSAVCIAIFARTIYFSFSNQTPLHCAALGGHITIVQLLLSYNAAVDARTSEYLPYHR
jgi:hypothetical protein